MYVEVYKKHSKKVFLNKDVLGTQNSSIRNKRFISEIPFANEIKTTENLDINSIITDY